MCFGGSGISIVILQPLTDLTWIIRLYQHLQCIIQSISLVSFIRNPIMTLAHTSLSVSYRDEVTSQSLE